MLKVLACLFVFVAATALAEPAMAWQLQNLSKETRVFDEFPKGAVRPITKTARPGAMVSFSNIASHTVLDRKTGQRINNPSFRHMIVTAEGYLKIR